MTRSLIRKNQLDAEISGLIIDYGKNIFVNYDNFNQISGKLNLSVFTSGDQSITGIKSFTTRPNVNGSGIFLQGESVENTYQFIDYSITASPGNKIATNTQNNIFTITLPANPPEGTSIEIFDYTNSFETNNLIIARNGQLIEGLANNLICDINGSNFKLIYINNQYGWQIIPIYSNKLSPNSNGLNLSTYYPNIAEKDSVVFISGNQAISGLKNFYTRPQVNGSGVLLIGEATNNGGGGGSSTTVLATGENVVYTTGDQVISGLKQFYQAGDIYGNLFAVKPDIIETLLDSSNSLYSTKPTRNGIIKLNFVQSTTYLIDLPSILHSEEQDTIRFDINNMPLPVDVEPPQYLFPDDLVPPDPEDELALEFPDYSLFEVNFYSDYKDENGDYNSNKIFIKNFGNPEMGDSITFKFTNNSWIVDSEYDVGFIPEHVHSIDEIIGLEAGFLYSENFNDYKFTDGQSLIYEIPYGRSTYSNLIFDTKSLCVVDLPNPTGFDLYYGDRTVLNIKEFKKRPQGLVVRYNKYDKVSNQYLNYSNLYTLNNPEINNVLEFWFQTGDDWELKSTSIGGGSSSNTKNTFVSTGFFYSGAEFKYDPTARTVFEGNVFINKINNQTSFGVYNYYSLDETLPLSGQMQNLPEGIRTGNIVNIFYNNSGLNNSVENAILVQPMVMVEYTGNIFTNDLISITGHPFYKNRALKKINYGSSEEFKFSGDLTVTLSNGKTFGKYLNSQIIPASGKTPSEVIQLAISETINPTVNLSVNPTTLLLGQTNISNQLSFNKTINNPGATVTSALLQWKRGNESTWTTLSTNPNISSFTHNTSNTIQNINNFNYQYIIVDSQNSNASSAASVSFSYGNYFGYSSASSLTTVAQIEALGNQILSDSKSRSVSNVTAGAGLYTYYAYKSAAGDLSSIIQDGAAPVLGAFIKQNNIVGTNLNGASVTYTVYRSNATQAFTNNNLQFN